MGRRKKWKVNLLSGQAAALLLLSGLFLTGSAVGCVAAGLVTDPDGVLLDYVKDCLGLLAKAETVGRFWHVLWELAKLPLAVVLLSFTAVGLVGLPVLFAVRGFLLSYSVSVFYRLFGPAGLLHGFLLFGFSALIWMPILFQLGVQGVLGSYSLLRRTLGEGRYPLAYNAKYLVFCGVCLAGLFLCAGLECLAVPVFLKGLSGG